MGYAREGRGRLAVIHGDPVFTNTFLTPSGSVMLVDPRGHLNGRSSLLGDANYDLAKVYQSLVGYEGVLFGRTADVHSAQLREWYETWLTDRLDPGGLDDIRWITASLFLSMLPLHAPQHGPEFLDLSQRLIAQVRHRSTSGAGA